VSTPAREIERLLEQAREEGREAGRSEAAAQTARTWSAVWQLETYAGALESLATAESGTASSVASEAAGILQDGAKELRKEVGTQRTTRRKKKSDGE
jgi:hypothetical protein